MTVGNVAEIFSASWNRIKSVRREERTEALFPACSSVVTGIQRRLYRRPRNPHDTDTHELHLPQDLLLTTADSFEYLSVEMP
jgi:hypothetical protein